VLFADETALKISPCQFLTVTKTMRKLVDDHVLDISQFPRMYIAVKCSCWILCIITQKYNAYILSACAAVTVI